MPCSAHIEPATSSLIGDAFARMVIGISAELLFIGWATRGGIEDKNSGVGKKHPTIEALDHALDGWQSLAPEVRSARSGGRRPHPSSGAPLKCLCARIGLHRRSGSIPQDFNVRISTWSSLVRVCPPGVIRKHFSALPYQGRTRPSLSRRFREAEMAAGWTPNR